MWVFPFVVISRLIKYKKIIKKCNKKNKANSKTTLKKNSRLRVEAVLSAILADNLISNLHLLVI